MMSTQDLNLEKSEPERYPHHLFVIQSWHFFDSNSPFKNIVLFFRIILENGRKIWELFFTFLTLGNIKILLLLGSGEVQAMLPRLGSWKFQERSPPTTKEELTKKSGDEYEKDCNPVTLNYLSQHVLWDTFWSKIRSRVCLVIWTKACKWLWSSASAIRLRLNFVDEAWLAFVVQLYKINVWLHYSDASSFGYFW